MFSVTTHGGKCVGWCERRLFFKVADPTGAQKQVTIETADPAFSGFQPGDRVIVTRLHGNRQTGSPILDQIFKHEDRLCKEFEGEQGILRSTSTALQTSCSRKKDDRRVSFNNVPNAVGPLLSWDVIMDDGRLMRFHACSLKRPYQDFAAGDRVRRRPLGNEDDSASYDNNDGPSSCGEILRGSNGTKDLDHDAMTRSWVVRFDDGHTERVQVQYLEADFPRAFHENRKLHAEMRHLMSELDRTNRILEGALERKERLKATMGHHPNKRKQHRHRRKSVAYSENGARARDAAKRDMSRGDFQVRSSDGLEHLAAPPNSAESSRASSPAPARSRSPSAEPPADGRVTPVKYFEMPHAERASIYRPPTFHTLVAEKERPTLHDDQFIPISLERTETESKESTELKVTVEKMEKVPKSTNEVKQAPQENTEKQSEDFVEMLSAVKYDAATLHVRYNSVMAQARACIAVAALNKVAAEPVEF